MGHLSANPSKRNCEATKPARPVVRFWPKDHIYYVRFAVPGETEPRVERFVAANPGAAFYKCWEAHPGCTLIQALRYGDGGRAGGYGVTTYEPPSLVSVEAGPASKAEQTSFEFYRKDRTPEQIEIETQK